MGSLIGKALRNQGSPVPVGATRGMYGLSSLAAAGSDDEAYMRAYGTQGTVHSNISLLATSAAEPEWKLFRKQPVDGRRRYTTSDQGSDQRTEVVNHQALRVLQKPATIMTDVGEIVFWDRPMLFEISGIWLETTGKSHWVVERHELSSIPLGLWPVPPHRMTPLPDKKRYLAGWIYTSPDGQEKIPLGVADVIYNRYPNPLDVHGGMGPVQSVLVNIDAIRYASEWNRNFFINSARPDGVIELDPAVEDVDFDAMEARWREAHRGVSRAHRVAVLEAGAKWVQTGQGLKDMDFAQMTVAMRDAIREALGMHKVMTGVTDDVNRANAQTGEEVFASWKIKPRLNRWRGVLNLQYLPLFGSAGEGVEFDYAFPMPLNREQDNAELLAKAQASLWLIEAGYDPADVSEVVGLPAMKTIEGAGPINAPGTTPALPGAPDAGEQAAEPQGGGGSSPASNLLRWAPFPLHDDRLSRVNGAPLARLS